MSLRRLLMQLLNNEEVIRRLSESYPIRRAAQLTAYFIHKGKEIGDEKMEKLKESDMVNRLKYEQEKSASQGKNSLERYGQFFKNFKYYFKDEWDKENKSKGKR